MTNLLASLFVGWHAEAVPLAAAAGALLLYDRGSRRLAAGAAAGTPTPTDRDKALLATGIGVILVALLSPLDGLALQLQWVHMVQHVLLLVVAPPLIVLARPWDTGRAALPSRLSRALAVPEGHLGARSRGVTASTLAVILFVGVLWLWHIPGLYNLTLRNDAVHNLEHTAFLGVGLLFWTAALPRADTGPALGMVGRCCVVLAGMAGSWLLAIYIGYASTVLFAYGGRGGLSALSDQQIAAGVMWVPGSVPFVLALVVLAARWFENDARAAAAEAGLRGEAPV